MEVSIIDKLSSKAGTRSNEPNKSVAAKCIKNPEFIKEIASGLNGDDKKLVADCAEVFTEIALSEPTLIVKYAHLLIPLLKSKDNRIKWESIHALSLVAALVPDLILTILPDLEDIMEHNKGIIVRDYITDAIANYAGTSPEAADKAYPILKKILILWEGRHAARAIGGLINIYKIKPALQKELGKIAEAFIDNPKGVIRKAALKLKKEMNC